MRNLESRHDLEQPLAGQVRRAAGARRAVRKFLLLTERDQFLQIIRGDRWMHEYHIGTYAGIDDRREILERIVTGVFVEAGRGRILTAVAKKRVTIGH